jgi:glycosyltransferase involved in cell wall biosynthesis
MRQVAVVAGRAHRQVNFALGEESDAMKIAFINQPQDSIMAGAEQRGSVAIVNWELARQLAQRHEVIIYAPRLAGQRTCERWGGIEIRRVRFVANRLHKGAQLLVGHFIRGRHYFNSRLYFLEYYLQVARDLRRRSPDIVHLPEQVQFASMFRRKLPRAKIVVHMHQDALAHLDHAGLRECLNNLDAIVTVSDYVTNRVRARFPEFADRIQTIGNGVDVEHFRPSDSPARATTRLLFVGRVSPDKGVHLLIDAFDILAHERADLELMVVGKPGLLPFDLLSLLLTNDAALDSLREFYGRSLWGWLTKEVLGHRSSYLGALRARLSQRTAGRVHFTGTLSRRELIPTYQQADLLVLPSVWQEAYGLPVVEAMASGVPVLASRCGGVPELIDDGVTGLLVPQCSLDALLTALRELIADPRRLRNMGRAARTRAGALLTWKHSAERLEQVYQRLVEQGHVGFSPPSERESLAGARRSSKHGRVVSVI